MTQKTIVRRSSKKIPAHYGMSDFYKYYKEHSEDPVSPSVYNKVVSLFNEKVIDEIINKSKVYTIPFLRLKIGIRKSKPKIKFKDGVVVNGNPVDWVTTKKLWETDEEAKKNKTLVRFLNKHTFGYVFKIHALKFAARFKDKALFRFKPNRKFQRDLSKRINDKNKDRFDSFLLYEENN